MKGRIFPLYIMTDVLNSRSGVRKLSESSSIGIEVLLVDLSLYIL